MSNLELHSNKMSLSVLKNLYNLISIVLALEHISGKRLKPAGSVSAPLHMLVQRLGVFKSTIRLDIHCSSTLKNNKSNTQWD